MGKTRDQFDLKKGVNFIGVTCIFFCHDGKGNFLMHKRSKNCRDEIGRWDSGSGSMEFGETFEDSVKREILEEYCVKTKDLKLCGVNNIIRTNNGKKTHWVAVVFSAHVDSKKVKIGEPHKMDEIGWFSARKLPKPLHSQLKKHLVTARKASAPL